MKKETEKSVKKEKKETRKNLFEKLVLEISAIVEKHGFEPKKSGKEIKKVANHLAKKLSSKLPAVKKPVKPAAKAAAKPAVIKEKPEAVPAEKK